MPVSFPQRQRWVERYIPPWYTRPIYYVPITIAAAIVTGVAIYWSILAADMSRQAESFDLKQLEQMESASVIVDRNDKIFGQIYVENRETVPYDQLPRDLVNAVVSMEDNKFYHARRLRFFRHHARVVEKFHRRSRAARREHGHATAGAKYLSTEGAHLSPQAGRNFSGAPDRGKFRETEDHGACI